MKFKFILLFFIFILSPNFAAAATYAWSESLGYFDFSNVVVSTNSLSGHAYNDNSGFLNMEGVSNDGNGNLSGYAWSESSGYFDFSNVTIANNLFNGFAYNDNTGFLNMTGVTTSWSRAGGSGGTNIKKRVDSLESQNKTTDAQDLREKFPRFFNIDLQSLSLQELTDLVSELQAILKNRTASTSAGSLYENTEYNRDLELGLSGEDVKKLQNYLINQGYLIPDGVTGYFGKQTRLALINFQTDKLIIPAAGYFGPITKKFIINNI